MLDQIRKATAAHGWIAGQSAGKATFSYMNVEPSETIRRTESDSDEIVQRIRISSTGPAAAVIRRVQALSGFTGRKGLRRRYVKSMFKYFCSTEERALILAYFEAHRGSWNLQWSGEMR